MKKRDSAIHEDVSWEDAEQAGENQGGEFKLTKSMKTYGRNAEERRGIRVSDEKLNCSENKTKVRKEHTEGLMN